MRAVTLLVHFLLLFSGVAALGADASPRIDRLRREVTAGNRAAINEYDGGHSFLNWSSGTANGLVFLLGKPQMGDGFVTAAAN